MSGDVRTWMHSRKGLITGRLVREDDTWMHIELVGDHQLSYRSESEAGRIDSAGEVMTVRRSLMSEVPSRGGKEQGDD